MSQPVTVHLPDDALQRYQRGAAAAQKPVEAFIADRLIAALPPTTEGLPVPVRQELEALEAMEDMTLWEVTKSELASDRQELYEYLTRKNHQRTLAPDEQEELKSLGEAARLLTLKKAHAFLLLKWRGHTLPSPE